MISTIMAPIGEKMRGRRQFDNRIAGIEMVVRHLDEFAHAREAP
jgi:hypothetical protein